MGWESQLCFPYPKWGPFPLLLIPCRIWNSPMSCAGSAGLTRIIAGLAIPVHPTVCGKWTSPNNLGSSSLPPWVFWTIYIMGSLPVDRTATLLMKFRPLYAPDLVRTMICQPRDPYVPFLIIIEPFRPWLESMGPSCIAYDYFSIVEFSSHMLYNPPRRTLFTSGAIQALILCRGFPYCVFWLFNSCEGFLLLHVINSFLETSCLQHRRSNCASSRASSGHFL